VLERAGTGDLLSRITTDIDRLANAMREAVPQLAIGVVWAGLLLGALTVTAPPLALSVLIALPVLILGCRWYFRRAPSAYRSEAAG
jgi:ABC-type transport system involved in cytochrome bd biosynthesis fused ATPase/permease subunit